MVAHSPQRAPGFVALRPASATRNFVRGSLKDEDIERHRRLNSALGATHTSDEITRRYGHLREAPATANPVPSAVFHQTARMHFSDSTREHESGKPSRRRRGRKRRQRAAKRKRVRHRKTGPRLLLPRVNFVKTSQRKGRRGMVQSVGDSFKEQFSGHYKEAAEKIGSSIWPSSARQAPVRAR